VRDYVLHRPRYPKELVAALAREGLTRDAAVADVGSGTGISARMLIDAGYEVFAIEPNGPMRAAAEAELAHLEHDAIMLSTDRDVVVAQMNELLHRDPEAPLPPPPATLRSPDAISGHLADDRPDIRAAHSRSLAAVARADRARRDWVPDLTLSTTYNSMWDMPEHRWMVGLGLTLPIELGHRAGAVDEAEAERVGYEAQVMALGDKARTAVTIATRRLEEARHLERLLEEKLTPIAHAQVDAARSGFATSRNDFATVIAAERNLRSVQLDAERASADIDRRAAELDYAMGRMPGPSGRGAAR
jgi:outer membrane protein TolC